MLYSQMSQDREALKIHYDDKHINPPPPGLFLYPPQPGGGGGRIRPPPCYLETDGRRETHEAAFGRSRRDASKPLSKFKIEVTCQVKVRSKVTIGCFQVADRSDLKRSMFRPKLSIRTPKDQAKVLTSEIVSYLARSRSRSGQKWSPNPKFSNESFDTCFMVHFGRRTW